MREEIGQIAEAYPGRYGVVIFDPSTNQTVSMEPDGRFLAASINKLPVLMTLYRAAAAGQVDLDDEISMRASDIQAYGTGSLQTQPVGYTMTLRECATFLIKESDNTAWKMLDRYLGRDYIRSELYRVGARSTEYWIPNTTTPSEVLLMLENISDPSYTSPELSAEMLDLITKLASVRYDPAAKAPTFYGFIRRVLPNGAIRRYVRKALGYSLSGSSERQEFYLNQGVGDNGKNTLYDTILTLMGDYATTCATVYVFAECTIGHWT